MELWKPIPEFPNYEVSTFGQIRNHIFDRIMALNVNQFGVFFVGLFREGEQFKRSVPLLVANAFIPRPSEAYDTPINLNGDRSDNHVENLVWRPRWFAVQYNHQFKIPPEQHIPDPIEDTESGDITENSFECAKQYGLLENDVVLSILNRTYVWPTYQQFRIIEN